jgi:hypothetical protein
MQTILFSSQSLLQIDEDLDRCFSQENMLKRYQSAKRLWRVVKGKSCCTPRMASAIVECGQAT